MSPGDPASPDVSLYELTQLDIRSEGMAEMKDTAKIIVGAEEVRGWSRPESSKNGI